MKCPKENNSAMKIRTDSTKYQKEVDEYGQ